MLNRKSVINKESFALFDSAQLADTINHDIENIPIAHLCLATHNYDIMFIEKVLNAIELQADIDRFAAILKIRWKIDVSNNRMEVVKLNTETKLYEPYHPQFENDVDAIVEKIRQKRELELSLKKLLEEWNEVRHEMSSTTTQANMPSEISQTSLPTFSSDESVIYHLDDLPTDVQNQILITDDKVYSDFVTTMRGPVKSWIDKRRLQDWNVVRFVCRLRGIVTRKCSLFIFGKLLERIGLGNQENNMKQRSDANDKNALVAYDDLTNRNPKYYYLRKDGSDVEELLSDVIKALAA
jgi:hypothetical protein